MQGPGLYLVIDRSTGAGYIGATVAEANRFVNHNADLRNNRHHNHNLQEAYNNGHLFETHFVDTDTSEEAFAMEGALIEEYLPLGSLYNHRQGMTGKQHTPESIEKMRQAHLGRRHTEETKQKMSESAKGKNLGKKRTEEQILVLKDCRKKQAKAVVVDGKEYESVSAAAIAYNINPGTAASRMSSNSPQFSSWSYK